jgi:hypothetical protein
MTSTSLITLCEYLASVKALVIYADIQKQRGRGLQEGVRLSMDPQNPGLGSHTDNLSLSTNNEAGTGADSSAGQDREVSAGHSNDSEYITRTSQISLQSLSAKHPRHRAIPLHIRYQSKTKSQPDRQSLPQTMVAYTTSHQIAMIQKPILEFSPPSRHPLTLAALPCPASCIPSPRN